MRKRLKKKLEQRAAWQFIADTNAMFTVSGEPGPSVVWVWDEVEDTNDGLIRTRGLAKLTEMSEEFGGYGELARRDD